MTIAEQIMVAVRRVVGANTQAEFTRYMLRREIGVGSEIWKASFDPTFQGMRADQPGGAPVQAAKHIGMFRRVRHGVYVLTAAGQQLIGARTSATHPGAASPAAPGAAGDPGAVNQELSASEGRELMRLHRVLERNRALVRRKKAQVLAERKRLECEACGFDFAAIYGSRGEQFAECHHAQPLAELRGERRTALSELQVVCANCHRMLHVRPLISVAELRALVLDRRSS